MQNDVVDRMTPEERREFEAERRAVFEEANGALAAYDGSRKRSEAPKLPEPPKPDAPEITWGEPEPLIAVPEPLPYPVAALPKTVRKAVEEVQAATQAPLAMVATCALAAVSTAAQGLWDVARDEELVSPTSLFCLIIAESGERKTSVDKKFIKPIWKYEADKLKESEAEREAFRAEEKSWTAVSNGISDAIRQAAKKGGVSHDLLQRQKEHEKNRPKEPRREQVIYKDMTTEGLLFHLAKHRPSAAIIVPEAGGFLGGHAANADNLAKTLSALNELWDGSDTHVTRRTSESFSVRGARLTLSFQIQDPVLRGFFEKRGNGATVKGIGFLARILLAEPESTQGTRLYKAPPKGMPALREFEARLSALLNTGLNIVDGRLTPGLLRLSRAAFEVWRGYHDVVEPELRDGGELENIRDAAAKSADNAARIAALLHAFEGDTGDAISAEMMQSGCDLALWHLREALRFAGRISMPGKQADAARLEKWLLKVCREKGENFVSTRDAIRLSPFRTADAFYPAANTLEGLGRAKIVEYGKKKRLCANPAVLNPEPEGGE